MEARDLLPQLIMDNLYIDASLTIMLRNKLEAYKVMYQIHVQKFMSKDFE